MSPLARFDRTQPLGRRPCHTMLLPRGHRQPPEPSAAAPSSYVVVARRYRPKTFEDLVGQQQMTQALINAINTNRVGHAYLFTGARGVGKTSTARIFAKALNAPNGPTPHPDNDSDICQAIDAGEDVDVIEIDGASNRGIDEIRQLRSNANVRPSRARYKIYIIDEVHMLTTAAFNALLKTLEEPPPHVKFILCTTDPQKIPITVLSRCQRYDFAPVDVPSIRAASAAHRGERRARSGARGPADSGPPRRRFDARQPVAARTTAVLLQRARSGVEDVHRMLGTAASGRLAGADRTACSSRDAAGALAAIDEAVAQGVDCGQLAEQLLGYFRDLMAVGGGWHAGSAASRQRSGLSDPAGSEQRFGLGDDPGGVRDPRPGGRPDAAEHAAAHAAGDRRRPHLPPRGPRSAGGPDRATPQRGIAPRLRPRGRCRSPRGRPQTAPESAPTPHAGKKNG